jgi:hypothetical protein
VALKEYISAAACGPVSGKSLLFSGKFAFFMASCALIGGKFCFDATH